MIILLKLCVSSYLNNLKKRKPSRNAKKYSNISKYKEKKKKSSKYKKKNGPK